MNDNPRFSVFISGVSTDFENERTALRNVLEQDQTDSGYTVYEQKRFENSGIDSLLQQIQSYVLSCDAVIAMLGPHSGHTPEGNIVAYFREFLPPGFSCASITQWEIFYARMCGKRIFFLARDELFDSVSEIEDKSQREYIKYLKGEGVQRKAYKDSGEIVGLAKEWLDQQREDFKNRASQLDGPVAEHLRVLRTYSLSRLSQFAAGEQLNHLSQVHLQFAHRSAELNEDEILRLPIAVKASALIRATDPNKSFASLLIVADAGDGKTTLVHTLLCEMAQDVRVEYYRLVPILADCVTFARLLGPDSSQDLEAVKDWLKIAVAPRGSQVRDEAPVNPKEFLAQVKDLGFQLLIIIDGLDELDPAGVSVERIERLFKAFDKWQAELGMTALFLATCRKANENLQEDERVQAGKAWGLLPVKLRPVEREEIRILAGHLLITPNIRGDDEAMLQFEKTLEQFVTTFFGTSIGARLVYLRPLARFFRNHPEEAMKEAMKGSISNLRLMQEEVKHIKKCICEQLVERRNVGQGSSQPGASTGEFEKTLSKASPEAPVSHVLLEIAMLSLNRFDRELPSNLSKNSLARLPGVRQVWELTALIAETQSVVERLLHVLVYVSRDPDSPGKIPDVYYRLPHNEIRDYLLADGLLQWGLGEDLINQRDHDFLADLACTYGRAERVKVFFNQIVEEKLGLPGSEERKAFARALMERMNGPLKSRHPVERTDVSPHGAMLSLLLTLGPLPAEPKIKGWRKSFQRAVVPRTSLAARMELPLAGNCKGASFAEADLRCADLSGMCFDGANFDNTALNGATARNASFTDANLRNVAMGLYNGLATDLTGAHFAGSDWFNYRFQGLKGYFHFWDLESIREERFVLAAGSRGHLLIFDLQGKDLKPVTIQTGHKDEIMDISRHPTRDVIVTTSRDGTIRLSAFPDGEPSTWPQDDGTGHVLLIELACRDNLFDEKDYPRRALFSASGEWLTVIARDPRIAVLPVNASLELGEPVYGHGHAGPVMCVVESSEKLLNAGSMRGPDLFFTAGYDGCLALWQEDRTKSQGSGWRQPAKTVDKPLKKGTKTEIIRSLAANGDNSCLWAGTELGGQLVQFKVGQAGFRKTSSRTFEGGVFSVAVHDSPPMIAIGLSNGRVKVFPAKAGGGSESYEWDQPLLDVETNSEIVRSLKFIHGGQELLVATWDACLFRFDLSKGKEIARFEYPSDDWRPKEDACQIHFAADMDPLTAAGGISERMKEYLLRVNTERMQSK